MFTSVVFLVDWGFNRFKMMRHAHGVAEVTCILVINALLIILTDNVFPLWETSDDAFWNVIDIYVICIICTLLSIINIQHTYHKELDRLRQEQARLRLNLLQRQLSPHFMFNSLSTLQGMIAADPQKAEEYVLILSDLFRYITKNIAVEKVPLIDAVDFIKGYSRMLNTRFPRHFVFSIKMESLPDGARFVPVSLQIAVENAIKHNDHSPASPLEISITLCGNTVEVRNKRQNIPFTDSLGTGLRNLNERYVLLTGKGLDISETEDSYTVKIPLIYESVDS